MQQHGGFFLRYKFLDVREERTAMLAFDEVSTSTYCCSSRRVRRICCSVHTSTVRIFTTDATLEVVGVLGILCEFP